MRGTTLRYNDFARFLRTRDDFLNDLWRSAFGRPQGMGDIAPIIHDAITFCCLCLARYLFLLSQPILLILSLDFALFCLSVLIFRFLLLVLFVLLLLFHPTIQDLHCYFCPYHLPAFSHDTPRPVQGYVFMPRCTFELELSKRYLFVSQHAYPFELLFFCGLVFIFLSRLFSLLSVPFPLGFGLCVI